MIEKDWKWQFKNRILDLNSLQTYISLTEEEIQAFKSLDSIFDFAITPYYLSLIDKNNPNCPIRKQIIPSIEEITKSHYEVFDPLGEDLHSPVKGVTHRYPDRALWYLSHLCAVYCRYCTRKRKVGVSTSMPDREDWGKAINYFKSHTELKEIILSGGDPFSLPDNQLDYLLGELKDIQHINHIRIHSRYPVTLPYRITDSLSEILGKYFPLFVVTHFNHSKEITEDSKIAISKLIKKGNVTVLNQSVLLKGVNDSIDSLKDLNYSLVNIGIKPYYLHQCDDIYGSSHFKVDIKKGQSLMKSLRGYMSGITIPTYVIDLTGGGGKVPLPTDYLIKEDAEKFTFENYQGKEFIRQK